MRGRLLGLVTAEGSWASVLPTTQAPFPHWQRVALGGEKTPTVPLCCFPEGSHWWRHRK